MPCGFVVRIFRDPRADERQAIETPPFPSYAVARSFGLRQLEKGMAVVKICESRKGTHPSLRVRETLRRPTERDEDPPRDAFDDPCADFACGAG